MPSYDETQPCLSLTLEAIGPDEVSPYANGVNAYTCARCGETFSERNPTFLGGIKPACDSYLQTRDTPR